MEVSLTPEQEAQLAEIARHQGLTSDALVAEVALGLLEDDDHEREIVRERLAQADAGIFIEEDEMEARFRALLQRR
jgi:predicted transcriptional regulator